jgi:hypothetical protein
VLDRLWQPFQQLGFTFEESRLNLAANLRDPPAYTIARRAELELALIRLPSVLFGPDPTPVTLVIANGIGYAFERGARLHLFAAHEDGTTEYLDTAIKSWTRDGVDAQFHPWRRLAELATAADPAAFVTRVFGIADAQANGGGPPAATSTDLHKDQFLALMQGLQDAFPSYPELQVMLRGYVDKKLAEISPPGPLGIVALNIIEKAEAQGWLRDLVTGARAAAPGNAALEHAAQLIPAALGGTA